MTRDTFDINWRHLALWALCAVFVPSLVTSGIVAAMRPDSAPSLLSGPTTATRGSSVAVKTVRVLKDQSRYEAPALPPTPWPEAVQVVEAAPLPVAEPVKIAAPPAKKKAKKIIKKRVDSTLTR